MNTTLFVDQYTQFSLDLINSIAPAPFLISPISILLSLSLAYVGAEGKTRQEFLLRFGLEGGYDKGMLKNLNLDEIDEHNFYGWLAHLYSTTNAQGNGILWIGGYKSAGLTLKTAYSQQLHQLYATRLVDIDVVGDSESAIKQINLDFLKANCGRIGNAVSAKEIIGGTT